MFFSTIIFLIIIGLLIAFHELGHFAVGKACGIKVNEFFIGFGPTLLSFEKGGTLFSLKLLPLGGACVFADELKPDDPECESVESLEDSSFLKASVWKRIATVAAGPVFNFILAYVIAIFVVANTYCDKPVLMGVIEGFPAEAAGMQQGDTLISLDGERIYLSREITLITSLKHGKPMDVVYEREGKRYSATLDSKLDEKSGRYLYGFHGYGEYFKPGFFATLQYAWYEVNFSIKSAIKGIVMLIQRQVGMKDMSGMVGMAVMVDDVVEQTKPYGIFATVINLMGFALMISANLGVMNLLPIPALDGGRLLFLVIEAIRRKALPPEKESLVHMTGFALLIVIMVLVLYNDIIKIIG